MPRAPTRRGRRWRPDGFSPARSDGPSYATDVIPDTTDVRQLTRARSQWWPWNHIRCAERWRTTCSATSSGACPAPTGARPSTPEGKGRTMVKLLGRSLGLLAGLLLYGFTGTSHAQLVLVPYDDFPGPRIDPTKWFAREIGNGADAPNL